MKKLILFLVRKHLGLKKNEPFIFVNQKSNTSYYFFTDDGIIKLWTNTGRTEKSHVSLNWLLDDECKIEKLQAI